MAEKSIKISIYKLEREDSPMSGEVTACLVAASSEKTAREIANGESGAEGYIWTDGSLVVCRRLGDADEDVDGLLMISRE